MTHEHTPDGQEDHAPLTAPPGNGPPPAAAAWPRFAVFSAFTLALLAVAGTAFLWWQYREFYVGLHGADLEIEASLERVRAAQRALADRVEGLGAVADASRESNGRLVERLESLPARLADLERRADEVPPRVADIERRLAAIQGGTLDAESTWLRAEAEYYLVVANAELELAGRWDNAATALELADGRLRSLADPALAPVRRQIAADKLALDSVERPDLERIVFELSNLAALVDALPLRAVGTARAADEEALVEAEPGLGRLLASMRRAVGTLITIQRRDDDSDARAASAERRALARRELGTELALARAGALQAERPAYEASLRAAVLLLERDFDAADAGVRAAASRLGELVEIDVAPPRPDISRSLALLRNLGAGSD
jgi:uroporphyrin-III C-methyltransferase